MTVLNTVAVQLVRRTVTGRDSYGNDVTGQATTIAQGVFAPGGSVEITASRDTVITQPTVYLPAGSDVTAVDQVIVNGTAYEIDGDPQDFSAGNPFSGWQAPLPLVVPLRKVTG